MRTFVYIGFLSRTACAVGQDCCRSFVGGTAGPAFTYWEVIRMRASECSWIVQGAETVYNQLIRPHLLQHQRSIDGAVEHITQVGATAAEGIQQALNDGATLVNQAAGIVRQRKAP